MAANGRGASSWNLGDLGAGGETILVPAGSAFAPGAGSTFTEAWVRRVCEVDDATLSTLMRLLVQLRRLKHGLTGVASVVGALWFGRLDVADPTRAALIYGTLAAFAGFSTLAVGSLTVRRLFLREASRLGLSRSTSMLLLTRAERRARGLRPLLGTETRVHALTRAVRAWDEP